ncbi:hypothetical protein TIFTF001_032080 [Ficus carica]|uniref:Uncharacterized protein n=1 Tax=Ficus carica TaxID=3494 RepID=A0AA88DWS2_FICCA|nr:hypothetical protein TIFTF001_032080 [Ficus carica]
MAYDRGDCDGCLPPVGRAWGLGGAWRPLGGGRLVPVGCAWSPFDGGRLAPVGGAWAPVGCA